ncbi:NAD(P)H-dependent oxidoreductase [Emticicia soli]|uniref:NAD(P)H-dependent oxidoreductase n=1 Tax=Emticicia soli TaxID=2027878 RepID=A0ABW5JFS7_9BACT
MKKVLLIQGHPDSESFNFALFDAYKKGLEASGAVIQEIIINQLTFDPNLHFGYRKRTELEPDLVESIEKIKWADHLVFFYPVWWGSVPALLKGFIDRVFLPGFVFSKRENSLWWDKLLVGKTGHIISTLDQPAWYYWLRYGRPTYHAMKQMTLEFCGVHPVRTTTIGPLRLSKETYRENWLKKVEKLGFNQK